nr:NAD(P)/FAD-dependent oxidoreductase [Mycolicibacter acidiphilus]
MSSALNPRHHVVIIGSGFGGLAAAKALKRADVDVTLISRTSHHLFQPLLYQVATGILSSGEVAPLTRLILRNQQNVRVLLGDVEAIDLNGRTVTSNLSGAHTALSFDSLIVAAGAQQSYFGSDEFAVHAPGMKTIDDALELRGRILHAFEDAEIAAAGGERDRHLTFVVVGAGPTGVEVAGQIVELAERTLSGTFRSITPGDCRVVLVDAAAAVLPSMGAKLGAQAQRRLQKMGVEVQLNAVVTDVDQWGIAVRGGDGTQRRIQSACKIWAAGVQASPLGAMIADQSDGTEVDRSGRVLVQPDLTVRGHPYVFVVGDLMALPGVPGVAQGAIQGAVYAANLVKRSLRGRDDPADRRAFGYTDKGSMATISRFSAVAQVGRLQFGGFAGWLAWLVLHLWFLVGFKNRVTTMVAWLVSFVGSGRHQLTNTSQMVHARSAMNRAGAQTQPGPAEPGLQLAVGR